MGNNEDVMDFEGLSNTEEGLKTSLLNSIITVVKIFIYLFIYKYLL